MRLAQRNMSSTTASKSSPLVKTYQRLKRNKIAIAGMVILLVFAATGMFAVHIAPYDPLKQDLNQIRAGISGDHWLGCDQVGRDILSRIIYGSSVTLKIALISVAMGLFVGTAIGTVGSYYGGRLDAAVVFLADVLLAFPGLLLAIAIIAAVGTGLTGVILSVGFSSIPQFIRLSRSVVLGEKERDYVVAARAIGESNLSIMVRYILPNCLGPILVMVTLRTAVIILVAAGLSFLGLGVQPPTPEWGAMLSEGRGYLRAAPHITIFPGLAIMTVVLALNVLGDALRDALDPRMKV
jgi:peptide/nickel transport system permease protein